MSIAILFLQAKLPLSTMMQGICKFKKFIQFRTFMFSQTSDSQGWRLGFYKSKHLNEIP